MANNGLSKEELMLAQLVDGAEKKEENPDVAKSLENAKEIKFQKAGIKAESRVKRTRLGTEVAVLDVKKSAKLKQQNDRIEFIEKRDKMFALTESVDEYKKLFNGLNQKQQLDVVKYFFEAIEDNGMNEIVTGERFPTSFELQTMKFLKGYLYLYYSSINEKIAFIKINKLPFVGIDCSIADIGRMIESKFTNRGTIFSSEGEKIDVAFKSKLEELKSKTKDIRYKEDV